MTTHAQGPYSEPGGAPAEHNPWSGSGAGTQNLARFLPSAALAAAGVVFGAFVVVVGLSSSQGFEWKLFLSMAALTLCFAGGAALSWIDAGQPVPASKLTGLLAALAIASLGLLMLSSWDGSGWVYGASIVMVVAGAAGYRMLGENLLTLPVVVGAVILISQAYSDIASDDDSGTGTLLVFGIVMVVLGAAIVAAGWRFPCRHLTGALGSIVAVSAMIIVELLIGIVSIFARAFGGVGGVGRGPGFGHSDRDLWIALILGIVVAVAVAVLGALSGLDRYLVIAFVGGSLCTLIGIITVTRSHPLRTAVAFAFVGGLVVAAAVLGDRIKPKPAASGDLPQWPPSAPPAPYQAPAAPTNAPYQPPAPQYQPPTPAPQAAPPQPPPPPPPPSAPPSEPSASETIVLGAVDPNTPYNPGSPPPPPPHA